MSNLLLVTGLSGAGKSTALKVLEDLGYETVDNVPLSLLPSLIGSDDSSERLLAAGADIRSRDFSADELLRVADTYSARMLFLTCDDEVLQRRYTETRRKHPLAQDRPVSDGIARERQLLAPIQPEADEVIDTTQMKPNELRAALQSRYAPQGETLTLFLQSFSFRLGVPRDADLVFDVRFLRNPHYVPELQPLSGRDAAVGDYIRQDEAFPGFFENLTKLLVPLLPRYRQEGKSYLTLAIGCTGGKHRSVFVTEELAAFLSGQGYNLRHRHRDIPG